MISIHALREEGDAWIKDHGAEWVTFLSTPSARRATASLQCPRPRLTDFYPRPPRGGRPERFFFIPKQLLISIHALREEGDGDDLKCLALIGDISIHALREEGDQTRLSIPNPGRDFYPRPPRGGRRLPQPSCCCTMVFLSTPSARRATW